MIVLDYMTPPADFATLKAHGVTGAIVYVAPAAWGWPKAVTPALEAAAEAAGFPLAHNFEQNPGDYIGGYAKGQTHGSALGQALGDLGKPSTCASYLSIDTEVPADRYPLAADYFRGAHAATSHPLDFYGQNELGEYLVAQGLARRLWQSESTSFPGNASQTPHVVVVQHYGGSVPGLGGSYDVNTAVADDWGQYPTPAAPVPIPTPKADPMLYRVPNTSHAVSINENGDLVLLDGVKVTPLHTYPTGPVVKLGPFLVLPSNKGRYIYSGATAGQEGTNYVLRQLFQHPDTGAVVERIYVLA